MITQGTDESKTFLETRKVSRLGRQVAITASYSNSKFYFSNGMDNFCSKTGTVKLNIPQTPS